MKKKSRDKGLKILGVIVALLLVGNYLGWLDGIGLKGFTTLSLSNAQFLANTQLPNGDFWSEKLWILTVVQGGLQQNAWYSDDISPDDIADFTPDNVPENWFNVDILYPEQDCQWDIGKSGESIYKYRRITWDCGLLPIINDGPELYRQSQEKCGDDVYYWLSDLGGVFTIEACQCWIKEKIGVVGHFTKSKYIHTKATIRVSNTEETKTIEFDTKESVNQGYIGNNVFYKWSGYLSKDVCPNVNAKPYWDGDKWKMGVPSYYLGYNTQQTILDTYINQLNLQGDHFRGAGEVIKKMEAANIVTDTFVTAQIVTQGTIFGEYNEEYSILKNPLTTTIADLLFTFYVKANWLGIYQPQPELRLGAVTCKEANQVFNSYVNAEVINDGESGGGSLSLSCQPPFEPIESSKDVYVESGQSSNYKMWWGVETSDDIERSCTVTLYSIGGGTDTRTVVCSAKPPKICDPEKRMCIGNKIKECNSAGSGYTITIKDCLSETKVCDYDDLGNPYCRTGGNYCDNDGDCDEGYKCINNRCGRIDTCDNIPWWDIGKQWECYQCEFDVLHILSYFECLYNKARMIATIIGGIIGFMFGSDMFGVKRKGKRGVRISRKKGKKLPLPFFMALAVGGLVAFLVYEFFLIGILAVTGMVLIKTMKPF